MHPRCGASRKRRFKSQPLFIFVLGPTEAPMWRLSDLHKRTPETGAITALSTELSRPCTTTIYLSSHFTIKKYLNLPCIITKYLSRPCCRAPGTISDSRAVAAVSCTAPPWSSRGVRTSPAGGPAGGGPTRPRQRSGVDTAAPTTAPAEGAPPPAGRSFYAQASSLSAGGMGNSYRCMHWKDTEEAVVKSTLTHSTPHYSTYTWIYEYAIPPISSNPRCKLNKFRVMTSLGTALHISRLSM